MRGWASIPSVTEIRRWAENLGLPVSHTGRLPRGLIARWNRENPDRPYEQADRFHGTANGYNFHGCRCQACMWWAKKNSRDTRAAQREDALWDDNGVLDLDPGVL